VARCARLSISLLGVAALAACNLAPTHQTPPLAVPAQVVPANVTGAPQARWDEEARTPSMTLDAWVQDDRLRQLLRQALSANRNLQQAVLNVERARAVYGIAQASQLPAAGLSAQGSRARTAADLTTSGRAVTQNQFSVQLGLTAFELDFWGRVRNLSEASLQQYLTQADVQDNVRLTLVGDVVQAWLNLAADQQRLRLARETLASREKGFALVRRMHELGATSGLVVAQNQSTVDAARLDVAAYSSQVAKDRHALELLAGGPVSDALLPHEADGLSAPATTLLDVPAALPSTVLLRRPDIQASEHQLRAMNANIGVARASIFPRINLTAAIGTASRSLSALFGGDNGTWSFAPGLSLPIFDGGALSAGLRLAEVDRELAVNAYDRAVQTAFKEVADALAERQTWQERLSAAESLVQANQRALDLSDARFKAGTDNYLSVLDAQRSLYTAQQQLISLRLAEQFNRVALYKALGGDTAHPH
jgi:NodT family efflux transporter outer membrane factor (OMF) lipoprotein